MNPADTLLPASGRLPQNPVTASTSTRFHVLLGWWLIVGGLGGSLLWAALAPLDQGVPLTGHVTVSGNRKTVQHQSGGTVQTILVSEGERVQAGQILVRMNSIQAHANAEITRIQLETAEATLSRLEAESGNARFRPADTGDTARHSQHQLLLARQRAMHSELAAMDETIAGLEAMNRSLNQSRSSRQEQVRLLGEQLESARALARDGFVARNRVLDLEREQAQTNASLAEESGNIVRNERQIVELRLRRLQRQQEFQRDVHSQLADIRQEVQMLRNRLQGLDHELASADVRSPVDGVVADVSIFTEGGVQVFLETLMVGNLLEKSLAFCAIFTATCAPRPCRAGDLAVGVGHHGGRPLSACSRIDSVQRQRAQVVDTVLGRHALAAVGAEDVLGMAAVGAARAPPCSRRCRGSARRPSRTSSALARVEQRDVLRRGDDHRAGQRHALAQRELDVAGARRHVDEQVVQVAPVGLAQQLLQRLRGHRAAPDHGLSASTRKPIDITCTP
jgi:multidrug efflux pump subunit AcrA (membrane-fusion protein)